MGAVSKPQVCRPLPPPHRCPGSGAPGQAKAGSYSVRSVPALPCPDTNSLNPDLILRSPSSKSGEHHSLLRLTGSTAAVCPHSRPPQAWRQPACHLCSQINVPFLSWARACLLADHFSLPSIRLPPARLSPRHRFQPSHFAQIVWEPPTPAQCWAAPGPTGPLDPRGLGAGPGRLHFQFMTRVFLGHLQLWDPLFEDPLGVLPT